MVAQDSLSWVSAICLLLGIWLAPVVLPRKAALGLDHGLDYDFMASGWASCVLELAKAVASVIDATTDLDSLSNLFGVARPQSKSAFGKRQVRLERQTWSRNSD